MVRFVETGRVNDVRLLHCIDQFEQGYAGGLQPGEIGHNVELRHLAALYGDGTDPVHTIQWRFQIVGGDLP